MAKFNSKAKSGAEQFDLEHQCTNCAKSKTLLSNLEDAVMN